MPPPSKAAPGQVLDGRFLLLEEIGRGGMSTVFKAADLENASEVVAVKVPLPQYASGLGTWSMFQREAEIGAALDHPYVLRFVPIAAKSRHGHVVTEYVPGRALSTRVGHGRRLAEAEALGILSRVCEAVEHLHGRQIVHYDLKPGNVLLCDDGSIRLIDFGMAHEVVRSRFVFGASAPPIASSDYVAPEQLRRRRGQPSVDIYALGAMLYEMLTGQAPFEGDDPFVLASARQIGDPKAPRAVDSTISPQAEEIVLRALRREPADRYPSVAAMKADLDAPSRVKISGLAGRLVEVTPWRRGLRWARVVALLTLAPIASLVAAFRVIWWLIERAHPGGGR